MAITPPLRRSSGARRRVSGIERRKAALRWLAKAGLATLRVLGAAAVSAALLGAVINLYRTATSSPAFAIQKIRFQGLGHAGEAELLARSGLRIGENVFHADLAAAARGMAQHPWVAAARLSRRLPGEIVVEVREHDAQALVDLGGLYASDGEGRLFKRARRGDALDLPLFTGLRREDWAAGGVEAKGRLALALQLLGEWRKQGLPASMLSEVRMDGDGGLTLFAQAGDVLEIHVGKILLPERLQRLQQLRAALHKRGERAVKIELDLVKAGSGSWATAQIAKD
jgi:cell division septal protein FtsQ